MRRSSSEVARPCCCACCDRTTGPSCLACKNPGRLQSSGTTNGNRKACRVARYVSAPRAKLPTKAGTFAGTLDKENILYLYASETRGSDRQLEDTRLCLPNKRQRSATCDMAAVHEVVHKGERRALRIAAQHDAAVVGVEQAQRHQRFGLHSLPRLVCAASKYNSLRILSRVRYETLMTLAPLVRRRRHECLHGLPRRVYNAYKCLQLFVIEVPWCLRTV